MTNILYDNLKIYICWLVRAGLQNRDTRRVPDWSRVGIRDSLEESGRSREIWDS